MTTQLNVNITVLDSEAEAQKCDQEEEHKSCSLLMRRDVRREKVKRIQRQI